ncbi:class I SAM-dependent methyltransferase, partial [Chloroflexota bacterium]
RVGHLWDLGMTSLRRAALEMWRRLVGLGFRLLYNEMAFLYDPVSWVVSLGQWRAWQKTVWPHLPPNGRVLEVGFGPGHLLVNLASGGYQVVGLDLSPAMLRLTQRRLRRRRLTAHLCRGQASDLPFAAQEFDAVLATFPTAFIYDPAWMGQLVRVLKPHGRLIVVEMASFRQDFAPARALEWLYGITGQRGPGPDLPKLLEEAGLEAGRTTTSVDGTTVGLVLAKRGAADRQD